MISHPPRSDDARAQPVPRTTQALRTISHCNQALARATCEAELLRDICQGIVDRGYHMAWVGFAEPDLARTVRVVGHAGDREGFLSTLRVTWADDDHGRGITGTAIRTGQPARSGDTLTDPRVAPWRADATRLHIRAGLSLPLKDAAGAVLGALTVYSGEPDTFDADETSLLVELASDLAYGIGALRARRAHELTAQSLVASEALLRQFIKYTPAAVAMFDRDLRYLHASDRWLSDYRLDGQTLIGRSHYEVFPDIPERWKQVHQRALAGAVERCDEDPFPRADGTVDWLEWEVRPWAGPDGAVGGVIMFTQVITERKQIALELRASEDRFRSAMQHSPVGMGIVSTEGAWLEVNPALCRIVGYTRDELLRLDFQRITHPDDLAGDLAQVERMLAREIDTYRIEKRYLRKDGRTVWILLHVSLVWNADGTPRHFVSQIVDIDAAKRADEAQRETQAKLQLAMELAKMGYWEYDVDRDRYTFDRDALLRVYDTELPAGIASGDYVRTLIAPADRAIVRAHIAEALTAEAGSPPRQLEHRVVRGDGSEGWVSARYNVVHDDAGRVVRLYGVNQDLTDRHTAEVALRESDERLRQLAANLREVVWMSGVDGGDLLYISPAYEQIWGRTCESLFQAPRSWLDGVHPDDRERVAHAAATQQIDGLYDEEYRVVRPDGAVRWVHDRAFPVKDAAGRVYRIGGVAEDVTDRRRIEEQFRQAQKMEAVGQLAGGVAHDFNNILAAIMMQTEEAASEPGLSPRVVEFLDEITRAADRAANLTRQLLQFSRKQVLQPRRLDLNESVTSLARMLQRVLREDIGMQLDLHASPIFAHADAGMVDQILMNLAVNARDAMPAGGRLVIETSEVTLSAAQARALPDAAPGRYACLRVSDSGTGIAPAHLSRIFEPFFTTKEAGKGTGLGLATVFGIVKQHRGWVTVASTLEHGTSFLVGLPVSPALPRASGAALARPIPRGGDETILVVEDEPLLRRLTRKLLARRGYTVVEASNGPEAIRMWDACNGRIDLLLTDLVMPEGHNGRELAIELQRRAPDLKVILISGYSADLAGRELLLGRGQDFLQKPCPPDELLEAVRRCLDAP